MHQPQLPALAKGLSFGIIGVQLLDVVIHAASDQLEPVRVASNILILIWVTAYLAGRVRARFVPVAVGAIGGYLLLNLFFLGTEGLTNAGEPRIGFWLLVCATVALATLLTVLGRPGRRGATKGNQSDV